MSFITENAESFVGLDFADKDTHPLASYAKSVEKARTAGLHVTTHAGEEQGENAAAEVREAIEYLGAERIGHGLHIINDDAVMAMVREQNVALELCPTSNWLTNAVPSTALHPIRRLMENEVPVTVNSDDPALFGIDLCHEYELLHREHAFSDAEFTACNELAARQSFVDDAIKRRVWPSLP